MRPLYVSGLVGAEAEALKAELAIPKLPSWPRVLLRSSGIDEEGEVSIQRILASYNRSNALNLAAFSALLRRVDGAPAEAASERVATDRPPEAVIGGALPKLLALDEVSADSAELIQRINLLGDRTQGRIVASVYRHLAHWPGFLALSYVQLAPLASDGRLDRMMQQAINLGESAGTRLQAGITVLPPPATLGEIRHAIADFLQHAIGRMVPIVPVLMASMPKE